MIDRQKRGEFVFECDNCTHTLDTDTHDFTEASTQAKQDGWRFNFYNDKWRHFCCQECASAFVRRISAKLRKPS